MNERAVLSGDVWSGSYYELALELGPRSDERLAAASVATWSCSHLDGPYGDDKREPWEQQKIAPESIAKGQRLVGVATVPGGGRVACATHAVREDFDLLTDWFILYIPLLALETVYDVHYDGTDDGWEAPLNEWLANIGRSIYGHVPFALGLIGEEVGGAVYAEQLGAEGIPTPPMLLPEQDGTLTWHP